MTTHSKIYENLPTDSIRILTLLPGVPSSELRCELQHAEIHLASGPGAKIQHPFEALSYTWGDPVFPQSIICNGSMIKITQNLFDALTRLRFVVKARSLWVDAICINQSDVEEKSRQIPLMKYIYELATQVVIWLGLEDDSTGRGLELIQQAAHCLRRETGQRLPLPSKHAIFPERFDDEVSTKKRGFPSSWNLGEWNSVVGILNRAWFSRSWITQESALATRATVQVGSHSLEWVDLCVAASFFSYKSYGGNVKGFAKALINVFTLCSFSRVGSGIETWRKIPLMFLLEATSRFQAKDPLDRIFSLLGLAEEEAHFAVDYSMSVRDLYTNVSRFLLQAPVGKNSYPLRILAHVKHYPPREDEEQNRKKAEEMLPSWVKRWHDPIPEAKMDRAEDEMQPMFVMSGLASSAKFYAGGSEYPGPTFNLETPYEVSLHGFVFGAISDTVNFLRLPPLSRPRLWDMILDIRSVREDRLAPYATGESIDEAFALTLTMADTITLTISPGAETYHAIDFQHFSVSIYEQTMAAMMTQGRNEDFEELNTKYGAEYKRLKGLVGTHIKSPKFSGALQTACLGRKLFATTNGYIGIGDITLEPGDLVSVLLGGKVPFILRQVKDKYRLVGECYLHGIMLGEAVEEGLQRRQLFDFI